MEVENLSENNPESENEKTQSFRGKKFQETEARIQKTMFGKLEKLIKYAA